ADWAKSQAGLPGTLVPGQVMEEFYRASTPPAGPLRAAGFDVGVGPVAGARGHLGYTGGCLWWDATRDRAFVLVCNRVHPTARDSKMEAFRAELAELLWGRG
ncbi:MAG: serine hydrolase, partial [Deltaproteobacteria bacterium]|nr:serine hydrolase [Deltaproteobacteria bacterium]